MGKPKRDIKERFEEKFEKDEVSGCWNWTASKHKQGYGWFRLNKKMQMAHRISYQLYIGSIKEGLLVCHHCDNPRCVNPGHLFLGTDTDNVQDCVKKGRNRYGDNAGEKHGLSKLTDEQVSAIRTMWSNGAHGVDLAKEFSVSQANISLIVHHRRWTK